MDLPTSAGTRSSERAALAPRGLLLWLTGLPCSGKSTIARELGARLLERGCRVEILDGDELRTWLSPELGYSQADRDRQVRRVGDLAGLLVKHGVIVIVALISPYRATRAEVLGRVVPSWEIHVDCPLAECERRDVKGLYARARAGQLDHFTGVQDPYEAPEHPKLALHTDREPPEASAARISSLLEAEGIVPLEPR